MGGDIVTNHGETQMIQKFRTHPKDVLHFKAAIFEPLDVQQFRQWNITDWSFAFCFAITQRVRCQAKVALLKVPATEAFTVLSMLRHHPVRDGREELVKFTIKTSSEVMK